MADTVTTATCLGTTVDPAQRDVHIANAVAHLTQVVRHLELAGEHRLCQQASDLNLRVRKARESLPR